jgi:hypothetical protein
MTQPFAGAPIVFGYSTVSTFRNTILSVTDDCQYFFQVAGLEDPFLVTVITYVLPSR